MKPNCYTFKAKIWVYEGPSPWHFVSLPSAESEEITREYKFIKRGWGSLPIKATIGGTSWETSIFPDRKRDAYLLPLKKEVRQKAGLVVEQEVTITIEILGL
jgi:hypothetical protein